MLSFKIDNKKKYPVFENINYLRRHIFETLIFTLFVRPIRVSKLIVDQDNDNILVTFTLLDAPPRTGPVEAPLNEVSLDALITRLESIVNSNGLAFRAKNGTKTIVLRAIHNSLNVAHQTSIRNSKSSGPLITGLWLGLLAAGLFIGSVGGYCIFGRYAKS